MLVVTTVALNKPKIIIAYIDVPLNKENSFVKPQIYPFWVLCNSLFRIETIASEIVV